MVSRHCMPTLFHELITLNDYKPVLYSLSMYIEYWKF